MGEHPGTPVPSPELLKDVEAVSRLAAVPTILRVITETTGLRFTLVARVTEKEWVACAVHDEISLGLKAGATLDLATTLCQKVRETHAPVAMDHASTDPTYCGHPAPRMYGFESYISVPLFHTDGDYFGTLCGLDPRPLPVKQQKVMDMMRHFSELISLQLAADAREQETNAELLSSLLMAEYRERFIAVLGHDLRAPLTSVRIIAEALLHRPLADPERTSVERIRGSVRRMTSMVTDLLDLARAKLGDGIGVALTEVTDLHSTLRDVVSELEHANPGRKVSVDIGPLGAVHCDRERLGQLLSNLVANALVHGDPHRPVDVRAERRAGAHGEALVVAVHNEGTPIAESIRERLFEPYTRIGDGSSQGLGLGLYIVKQISDAHGGALDVTSTAEQGTEFRFTLPLAPATAAETPGSSAPIAWSG